MEFKGPVEDESAEESCQQSTPLLLGKGVQNGESCRWVPLSLDRTLLCIVVRT